MTDKHKEVKSKVYKAVKGKDGKCVLVKKQRVKPKRRVITKVKPEAPVTPVTPVVPSSTPTQVAQQRELQIAQFNQSQKRQPPKDNSKQLAEIIKLSRQILHTGNASSVQAIPTAVPTPQTGSPELSSAPTESELSSSASRPSMAKIATNLVNIVRRIDEITQKIDKNEKKEKRQQKAFNKADTTDKSKKIGNDIDKTVKEREELNDELDELEDERVVLETELKEGTQGGEGNGKIEGGLMNTEINDMMKSTKSFKGSIPADMIYTLPANKVMNWIINKDKSGMPGSHWCAVYIDSVLDKECCYYDPLGNPPSAEVREDLRKLVKRINPKHQLRYKINTMKNQRIDTDSCGFMCMRFIKDMIKGDSFKKATGYCDKHNKDNSDHYEDKSEKLANKFGYI